MEKSKKVKTKPYEGYHAMTHKEKGISRELQKTYDQAEDLLEILEDGDFVMDGYRVHLDKDNYKHNDDLDEDLNDYETQQEDYAFQSEDSQPIAVDRFVGRFRKSSRSSQ